MPLSTFPLTPLPIRAEMQIGGTWTDITSRVRLANEIIISNRGKQNEQGRPGVCTCSFTLNNRDGYFSTRAPGSVNYGKLGKNTPFRVSVTEDRGFAIYDSAAATRVKTTDKASLDIVGDIDVRCEYEPDNPTYGLMGFYLASKFRRTASANRSWYLAISPAGQLVFNWSTDGTSAGTRFSTSSAPITPQYGPIAVRVTLQVNNGAGGCTISFYTSDTIAGTWVALGTPQVSVGTTNIFSGTGELELGRIDDGNNLGVTGFTGLIGRIYAFEMRSGIGGTVVANAAITAQVRGTTSWSDGLTSPNTWTTNGNAEITPDDRRFTGEMAALPQQWDPSGRDVFVPAVAADVTRRLTQGGTPLFSAWRNYWLGNIATGFTGSTPVTGYWPFEDGSISKQSANFVPGGAPGVVTDGTFGRPADLPATTGSLTINSLASRFTGNARRRALGQYSFANFAFKMPAIPASSTTLIDFNGQNDIGRINISVTGTSYNVAIYDASDVLITSSGTLFVGAPPNAWTVMRLQITQGGGTVQVDLGWYQPGANLLYGAAALVYAGNGGVLTSYVIKGTSQNIGTQFAHLAMGNYFLDNTSTNYTTVADAFSGETPSARFTRNCTQAGVNSSIVGELSSERMGPQPLAALMDVLYECSDVEQGLILPDRNSAALVFRTRRNLINQYGPSVSYVAGELGAMVPLPTDDDQLIRNTVTASRATGSSAVATVTAGPNGTASPLATPPGAGVYQEAITRNTYTDDRLTSMASWEAFLGTWDEPRWPQVRVDLERSPYTGSAAKIRKGHILAKLDVGDQWTLTGLQQAGVAPDDAILIIQGMVETLGGRKWWLQWNTSPAGPYIANDHQTGVNVATNARARIAAANCTVTAGFTSTVTGAAAFQVSTAAGSTLWGTTALKPGNFPLNVVIAGEVITVSGITGTSSPQTFNVSARSVNSVVKAHLAGETVQVQYPMYVTL